MILAEKRIGETPLECLERIRSEQIALGHAEYADASMTYAGRLDPLAHGILPILVGEECKDKERYLGSDKEYEIEVLFGVETETGDLMGLIKTPFIKPASAEAFAKFDIQKYVGKCTQEYPAYSSKTVGGIQLHELARSGNLPDDMPTKEVEIYEIEKLDEREVAIADILARAEKYIALVHGDFRQDEIIKGWRDSAAADVARPSSVPGLPDSVQKFKIIRMRVHCSSGTYMRSLAMRMGRDVGTGAIAFDIWRTKVNI